MAEWRFAADVITPEARTAFYRTLVSAGPLDRFAARPSASACTRFSTLTIPVEKYPGWRLHVRTIIRDGRHAFVGSQSLQTLALEGRREIGVIVSGTAVVTKLKSTFDRDWRLTGRRIR